MFSSSTSAMRKIVNVFIAMTSVVALLPLSSSSSLIFAQTPPPREYDVGDGTNVIQDIKASVFDYESEQMIFTTSGLSPNAYVAAWNINQPPNPGSTMIIGTGTPAAVTAQATGAASQVDILSGITLVHRPSDGVLLGYYFCEPSTHYCWFTNKLSSYATSIAAGDGSFGTNDGTGTGAQFSVPRGMCYHRNSRKAWLADNFNDRIREFVWNVGSTAADVTTLTGSVFGTNDGIASAATFEGPFGCAVAYSDEATPTVMFIAEQSTSRLRRLTPVTTTGTVTTIKTMANTASASKGLTAQLYEFPNSDKVSLFWADQVNANARVYTVSRAMTLDSASGVEGSSDWNYDEYDVILTTGSFTQNIGLLPNGTVMTFFPDSSPSLRVWPESFFKIGSRTHTLTDTRTLSSRTNTVFSRTASLSRTSTNSSFISTSETMTIVETHSRTRTTTELNVTSNLTAPPTTTTTNTTNTTEQVSNTTTTSAHSTISSPNVTTTSLYITTTSPNITTTSPNITTTFSNSTNSQQASNTTNSSGTTIITSSNITTNQTLTSSIMTVPQATDINQPPQRTMILQTTTTSSPDNDEEKLLPNISAPGRDLPPPSVAEEVTVSLGTVMIGVVGSTSAGATLVRVSVLRSSLYCGQRLEELAFSSNPTQLAIGDGQLQWWRGVVVGDGILLLSCGLIGGVALLVARVAFPSNKESDNPNNRVSNNNNDDSNNSRRSQRRRSTIVLTLSSLLPEDPFAAVQAIVLERISIIYVLLSPFIICGSYASLFYSFADGGAAVNLPFGVLLAHTPVIISVWVSMRVSKTMEIVPAAAAVDNDDANSSSSSKIKAALLWLFGSRKHVEWKLIKSNKQPDESLDKAAEAANTTTTTAREDNKAFSHRWLFLYGVSDTVHYIYLDATSNLVISLLAGIMQDPNAGDVFCNTAAVFMFAAHIPSTLFICWRRPLISRFDLGSSVSLWVSSFAFSFLCLIWMFDRKSDPDGLDTALDVMSQFLGILAVLIGVGDCIRFVFEYCQKKREATAATEIHHPGEEEQVAVVKKSHSHRSRRSVTIVEENQTIDNTPPVIINTTTNNNNNNNYIAAVEMQEQQQPKFLSPMMTGKQRLELPTVQEYRPVDDVFGDGDSDVSL